MRASFAADIRSMPFGWIDRWGLVTAQIFGWAALGPSLIPRRWWMTAIALALSQVSGYLAGRAAHLAGRGAWFVLARAVARLPLTARRSGRAQRRAPRLPARPTRSQTRITRVLIGTLVGAGTVVSLRSSVIRQTEIAALVHARMPAALEQLGGLSAGAAITTAALALEWLRMATTRRLRRRLRSRVPARVAAAIGGAAPLAVLWLLSDRAVRGIWRSLVSSAKSANDLDDMSGVTRPSTHLRSGSPASPIPWRALGRQGRAFVGSGQRATGISAATGREALEPIRVFGSVSSWRNISGAARAAANELRRTGAYDRKVLVLATTTGTGWLADWSIGAAEHLSDGDCATVAVQYTVLPSALAAIAQRNAPVTAARALLRAVERDLAARPRERRPRIYVTGESLGAFGVLGSVASPDDLLARVDGGVLAGAPRVSRHWNTLVAGRDDGSPEVAPVIDGGAHVRFATRPADLTTDHRGRPLPSWSPPRLALLQHASDPIVWWSPSLLVRQPDWMRERAGRDVTRAMSWLPAVTFWQVATDMPAAVDTPGGSAHRYFEEYVPAWAAVLGREVDAPALARITASIRRTLPNR